MEKSKPVRLQLKRSKGFNLKRLSKDTNGLDVVVVSRPSKWGNPFYVGDGFTTNAIDAFVTYWAEVEADYEEWAKRINKTAPIELKGKNLACWCKINNACHGDTLLEIANA